jgi:hypothetical protein
MKLVLLPLETNPTKTMFPDPVLLNGYVVVVPLFNVLVPFTIKLNVDNANVPLLVKFPFNVVLTPNDFVPVPEIIRP